MRLFLSILFALPLAFLAYQWLDRRENEARLGAIASEIAARPVEVDCPDVFKRLVDVSAHSGSVRFSADGPPGNVAQLDHATCSALDGLAEGRKAPLDAGVPRAVHVLAHEAFHLAGVRSEAAADCYAFQRSAYVATRLGSSLPEAQLLAQRALEERLQTAPPDYRSPECRSGGGLDLDHDRGSWP